jgi:hypothetical protein
VNPFPRPPDTVLDINDKLNNAVVKAIIDHVGDSPAKFPITIVDPANKFAKGGFKGDYEYYTGSLVKMGVLYAAFALLEMVKRFATLRSPKSANDLFTVLRTDMNDAIEQSSPLIRGANTKQRLPSYEKVLAVNGSGGKLLIGFNTTYSSDLRLMIVHSDNDAAGRCIHGLGFSYLNGALEKGGFFDTKSKKGIWNAGDFRHGWAPLRIPCENMAPSTGGTAQGATTDALAWLLAVIVFGNVFDNLSAHVDMRNLLKSAAAASFLTRGDVPNRLDASLVSYAKIGIGEDPQVYSEVAVIKGIAPKTDKTYIVAWQNIDWHTYWTWDIITIIKNAIKVYET